MIPCTIFSKDGPNNSFSSPLQYECGFPAIKCGYTLSHSVISDLCDPMDCSTPGSSLHGTSQARILEWVAISFSRESYWPRDRTPFSCVSYIDRQILYHCATKRWSLFPLPLSWSQAGLLTALTSEWKRQEISSWKLEIPREYFMQRWAQ